VSAIRTIVHLELSPVQMAGPDGDEYNGRMLGLTLLGLLRIELWLGMPFTVTSLNGERTERAS